MDYWSIWDSYFIQLLIKDLPEGPVVTKESIYTSVLFT